MPEIDKRRPAGPQCPHYPQCVGCALIGTPYGEQLADKRSRLEASLRERSIEIEVPPTVGSPRIFGYRNQAKLVARRAGGSLLLGVYHPGTHDVTDISRCSVHHPLVADALAAVRSVLEKAGPPIYDERSGSGWLRYVLVRASLWRRAKQVVLVVRDRSYRGEKQLTAALRRLRGVQSVILNLNDSTGNVIYGPDFQLVTREGSLIERFGDVRIKARAGTFMQANVQVAGRIYRRVVELVEAEPGDVVVDLYCGAGAIALHLSPHVASVYGVESSPRAILDAKENLHLNGVHNVRFYQGEAGEMLDSLRDQLPRIDLVTLNPPRKGADEVTRKAISSASPRRIIYVSCDAHTLARDLAWFAERGYETESVQPFDMLPQTEHVECVAALRRRR